MVLPLLGLLLGGCGFHLAGHTPLPKPLRSVYIDFVDPYHVDVPPLEIDLTERLRDSGATVVGHPEQAHSILRLSHLRQTRETVAIGANGRALEYRLTTSVRYEVLSSNRVLLPPETQAVSSNYSFNAQQILAKQEEESRLEKYIQNELAELLLMRIQARLTHLPPAATASLPATASSVVAPIKPAAGG